MGAAAFPALLGITAASTLVGTAGAVQQTRAQNAAAEAEEANARMQARFQQQEAIAQAQAERRQSAYEQNLINRERVAAERNAALIETQVTDVRARGEDEVSRLRRQIAGAQGSNRAALAAAGVSIGSGSALDIAHDVEALGDLDVAAIRANAGREAFGLQIEAANVRDAAAGARERSAAVGARMEETRKQMLRYRRQKMPVFAGYRQSAGLAATTSLLSGGSQIAGSWLAYRPR